MIGRGYQQHLEHLARIYVECAGNTAEAAERVRAEIPELATFRHNYFARWKNNAEWKAVLKAAQDDQAFESEFKPRVRGRGFLRWAREAAKRLAGEHEQIVNEAENDPDPNRRIAASASVGPIEGRIVKLNEAIRAEERHQDDLQDRAARRDMRTFARNLFELVGTFVNEEGERRLQDLQRDPAALMKGIE